MIDGHIISDISGRQLSHNLKNIGQEGFHNIVSSRGSTYKYYGALHDTNNEAPIIILLKILIDKQVELEE